MKQPPIDFQSIATLALAQAETLLPEWFPAGKRAGNEFVVGDLAGTPGSSLGVNIRTGAWSDFAGDAKGGDLISLRAAQLGISQIDAAKKIAERIGIQAHATKPVPVITPSDGWTPITTAENLRPPASPDGLWTYRNAAGHLAGYIQRVNRADGGKDYYPLTPCRHDDGRTALRKKAMPAPRPLYRLPELIAAPDLPVLVVEGEKAADAAHRMVGDLFAVVSWPGGAKAVSKADFTALIGRKVTIWPDNDDVGRDAAKQIRTAIGSARIVSHRSDWADGYDAADLEDEFGPGESRREAVAILAEQEDQNDEVRFFEPEHEHESTETAVPRNKTPFVALGVDKGTHFFISGRDQQVHAIAGDSLGKGSMLELAPLSYWNNKYMSYNKKGEPAGVNWTEATDDIIEASTNAGIYDQDRIRGRGAWIDGEKFIFHAGDHLIVNGVSTPLSDVSGEFIYQASRRTKHEQVAPMTSREASKVIELASLFSLTSGIDARLLAGWCAIAPICGIMHWRPHLWLNGPAGSGKSWIIDNFIKPLVGNFCVSVQSATTEAGLRQTIGQDAVCVIFDEAESENERAAARIQSVIELARQASSESGASIIKGSATGRPSEFTVHSMFLFASIGVASVQRADTSRINPIDLKKREDSENKTIFPQIQSLASDTTLNPEWCAALRSRTYANASIIRANAKTFARAVAKHLGDSRTGDQIGTLLAGAHSLTSSSLISADDALAWVGKQEWKREIEERGDADEQIAYDHLMTSRIRHESEGSQTMTFAVSELITMTNSEVHGVGANRTLQLNGMKVTSDGLFVASVHHGLSEIFKNTRFSGKHGRFFSRLPGASSAVNCKLLGKQTKGITLGIVR